MNTTKNTEKNTSRAGVTPAILLGCALAVAPIAAASQAGAAPGMVPTGPDIVLGATENLRQLMEADNAPAAPVIPTDKTLRQLMEADNAPAAPVIPTDTTLRQLMEADRAPAASTRPPDRPAPQLTEEDRPPSVSCDVPQPTVRPSPNGERR
ncbi:hypothetical protein ACFVAJ_21135 [Agromyces sp. NPDC057679]|uniref:hypothetical protein n=1 Tax=Agromyces sp. NPDC057679 TaxID=3346207 RepID=UPI00366C2F18